MRVLICHNYYQLPGGEDQVFHQESDLLEANGHEVFHFTLQNDSIEGMNPFVVAIQTLWNSKSYHDLCEVIFNFKPDLVHFHNTFPLISPSTYYAAKKFGLPVIQTLHNYRFLCLNAYLYRDGKICENCLRRTVKWPGVIHACYRDNRVASSVIAGMLAFHCLIGSWKKVDRFIAPTEFTKEKYIAGGIPSRKVIVKPHMVFPEPEPGREKSDYFLFAGRLSLEKGVATLLESLRFLESVSVKIAGSGPLKDSLPNTEKQTNQNTVEYYGQLTRAELFSLLKRAYVLVFPSLLYETFGLTIAEAFACGVPVIASNRGAMAELVVHGQTGLLFTPCDPEDLAEKMKWAIQHPKEIARMGVNARKQYKSSYTAEANYQALMRIYNDALMKRD